MKCLTIMFCLCLPVMAMAQSFEKVQLNLRFIPTTCRAVDDRFDCNGPERPLPPVEFVLNDHFNGRQVDIWTGSYTQQMNAEGHLFHVKISVSKRHEKMFNVTSYEVRILAHPAGQPWAAVQIQQETSPLNVNSDLKALNTLTLDGPKIVQGNNVWFPRVIVAAP